MPRDLKQIIWEGFLGPGHLTFLAGPEATGTSPGALSRLRSAQLWTRELLAALNDHGEFPIGEFEPSRNDEH